MDKAALAAIERMAALPGGALTGEQWRPMESAAGPYIGLWGESLPADALMLSAAQVCPQCLDDEQPFLHADWDFSLVTVCAQHKRRLISECPSCGAYLRWNRPRMAVCGQCAADLRRASVEPCAAADAVVADFAAAVAPFKFAGKVESLEPPESFFELGRLLCLSRDEFLRGHQERHFNRLPLNRRFQATQKLASCIAERKVIGDLVHRHLLENVSHISALLGESRARSRLFRFLASNDFLRMPLRRYLAYGVDDAEPMRAFELYQGKPPRIFTSAQARDFVGCTQEEYELAVASGLIQLPSNGLAFDVDHLLDVQRQLRSMLSEGQIDESFGVAGLCNWLLKLRLLRSERRVSLPIAVSVESFEGILDRLVQVSDCAGVMASTTVELRDVVSDISAELLATVIAHALNGGVDTFKWQAPWGWRQMSIDVQAWNRIRHYERY